MNFRFNWDAMGVATSLACAIHCAVLPLVLTSLPVFGVNIIENMNFEYFMIFLAAGIGGYSLWHGYRKHHHSLFPLIIFLVGIGFLFSKQRWHAFEYWLLPIAVVLIVAAHLVNYRACRIHDHAHKEDCDH
ncbi:MAG: MerC domain-containing protein [Chitinophagaceae bacterium]|nr:MerC domain-containing protein [Chitinophagaceae bacterium]